MEWTPQRLVHRGGQDIGPATAVAVTRLVLTLQIGTRQYRHVRNILANNRDRSPQTDAGDWGGRHDVVQCMNMACATGRSD